MTDTIGVAESLGGLITIADIIVRNGYKYFKEVKDAEKTVKKLIKEVNNLSGVLHSLRNVVEELESDSNFDPSTQIHYVESCQQTLSKIQDHFEKAVPSTPLSRTNRMVWPLKASQTRELLLEIERHKATMILAMSATEM